MENQERKRYFQFIAGERKGEVVVFDRVEEEDGIIFVCFKDNSRCNEELILPINERDPGNYYMAEIENPNNIWRFEEKWVGRQEEKRAKDAEGNMQIVIPFVEGRKKVTPIPPRRSTSNFGNITNHISTNPEPQISAEQKASIAAEEAKKNDPVWLMMDKAKKFDTEVEMTLNVALPAKSLYNVAKESFDAGGEKIIEYIISNLDDKSLKEALKKALKIAYDDEAIEIEVKSDERRMEDDLLISPEQLEKVKKIGNMIPTEVKKEMAGDDLFEPGKGGSVSEPIISDAPLIEVKENK